VADTPEAFVDAIGRSLQEEPAVKQKRIEAMAHEKWPDKLSMITQALEKQISL